MKEVVIVDAVRTPIGHHKCAPKSVRPDDLAAFASQSLECIRQLELDHH